MFQCLLRRLRFQNLLRKLKLYQIGVLGHWGQRNLYWRFHWPTLGFCHLHYQFSFSKEDAGFCCFCSSYPTQEHNKDPWIPSNQCLLSTQLLLVWWRSFLVRLENWKEYCCWISSTTCQTLSFDYCCQMGIGSSYFPKNLVGRCFDFDHHGFLN